VIVPHQSPAAARPVTSSICARHAARASSGGSGASQYDSTAGCIAATSATDESPWAIERSRLATRRVERAGPSHRPPASTGTPVSR
jgi:hypothetical protein